MSDEKNKKKKTEGVATKTRKPKGPQRPLAERIAELEAKSAARIAKINETMQKKINKMRGATGDPVKMAEKKKRLEEQVAAITAAMDLLKK